MTEHAAEIEIPHKVVTQRATWLSGNSELADGSLVLTTSHQRAWFYAVVLRTDGRVTRRRYRHDQLVRVRVVDHEAVEAMSREDRDTMLAQAKARAERGRELARELLR